MQSRFLYEYNKLYNVECRYIMFYIDIIGQLHNIMIILLYCKKLYL